MRPMGRIFKSLLFLVLLAAVAILALLALTPPPQEGAEGITVESVTVPDPDDKPLEAQIWFSDDRPEPASPLIVLSHGTGGSLADHTDTAHALAKAGYVVAAVLHTGDNYRDTSNIANGTQLVGRPRHVARMIDYLLETWPKKESIDPDRIGLFGFSAGGFTALVIAGGKPDMTRGPQRCREQPDRWDCEYVRKHGLNLDKVEPTPDDAWVHDERVKSMVIAAPAIGYAFEPDRLANVSIPVQFWQARQDDIVEDSPDIIREIIPEQSLEHHVIDDANHFSFMQPCNAVKRITFFVMALFGTPAICSDREGFDREAFHARFNREIVRHFGETLPESSQEVPDREPDTR